MPRLEALVLGALRTFRVPEQLTTALRLIAAVAVGSAVGAGVAVTAGVAVAVLAAVSRLDDTYPSISPYITWLQLPLRPSSLTIVPFLSCASEE